MAKNKNPNYINVQLAQKFLQDAYGFNSKQVNFYHLKIWHTDFKGVFDWYHTTGTIIASAETFTTNIGSALTDEDVAILIQNYVAEKET